MCAATIPRSTIALREARWPLCLVLALSAAGQGGLARAKGTVSRGYEAVASALSERIRFELVDKGIPGFVIALRDGESVVWRAGFGAADPERDRPMGADATLRCASISKLFTATLICQLAAEGRLDLDDPVNRWLPEFAPENPFDTAVTLRHLLGHRSGIVREPPVGHYFDPSEPSLARMVESLAETRLVAEPGSAFAYSNAAVGVAGRVVEVVLGVPFAQAVRTRILDPLGMTASSFAPWPEGAAVAGRMWTYDQRAIPCPTFGFGYGPAADLQAPMVDLLRFAGATFRGEWRHGPQLLTEADWRAMWRPAERGGRCGLGFFIGRADGRPTVGHGGAVYGFATQLLVDPDAGLAVAAGCNLDMANAVVADVAREALAMLRARRDGATPELAQRSVPVGRWAARGLRGTYVSGARWIRLDVRGDDLIVTPDMGTAVRVRRRGDRWITDDRTSVGRVLECGGVGGGDARELGWAGRTWRRLPEGARLPPAPPRWMAEYLGEYGWDHNRLIVGEARGQLQLVVEWLVHCPARATAMDDVFELPRGSMYSGEALRFERDDRGAVIAVWLGGCRMPRVADHEPDLSFRIRPLHDATALRRMAAEARAPRPAPGTLEADLVELRDLDPTLRYDVRYAGVDNFMGMAFYEEARVRMQRPAAMALVGVQHRLARRGLGLVLYDGYRPWTVTRMFFDATPEPQRRFVADPAQGSRHNRGCAIDLGLVDRRTGQVLPMVSGYDEFTAKASPGYPGSTSRRRALRELLRREMEDAGFAVYEHEWWHFDFRDWRHYPVLDLR